MPAMCTNCVDRHCLYLSQSSVRVDRGATGFRVPGISADVYWIFWCYLCRRLPTTCSVLPSEVATEEIGSSIASLYNELNCVQEKIMTDYAVLSKATA